jgi:6-phosphogluconolactonase
MQLQSQKNRQLLIGTYTKNCDSKGIYVYDFNSETGDLTYNSNSEITINPSYLTLSKDNAFVYAVNENGKESTISAFALNVENANLSFLNKQDSQGADPCYIINDAQNVIAANYSGGCISVFKKNNDGSISDAKQVIQHYGKSKNPERQEKPHVHMVQFTPDKKFVFVNDLGTDEVYSYKYNPASNDKILEIYETFSVKEGSGPRHLDFSPNSKNLYLLHELDATLTVFSYADGRIKKLQETTIADENFKGENAAGDIHVSPDGQFLFATNRGTANNITCFKIDGNGRLEFVQRISTNGKGPRNFVIDPSGNFLLVGHQDSNEIVLFSIDRLTGKLTFTGKRTALCSPVCLVFAAD